MTGTISQDMTSTTAVRIIVPRLDSTPSMPILPRMEVSAANTADRHAKSNHARLCFAPAGVSAAVPPVTVATGFTAEGRTAPAFASSSGAPLPVSAASPSGAEGVPGTATSVTSGTPSASLSATVFGVFPTSFWFSLFGPFFFSIIR